MRVVSRGPEKTRGWTVVRARELALLFDAAAASICLLHQGLIPRRYIEDSGIRARRWEPARDARHLMLVPVLGTDAASRTGCCILRGEGGSTLFSPSPANIR